MVEGRSKLESKGAKCMAAICPGDSPLASSPLLLYLLHLLNLTIATFNI